MSPAPSRNTRQKLLDTALDLFWKSSFGAVSVDDICRQAGVHKGSFYHFFDSKMALTIAAFEHYWESKRPVLDDAFSLALAPVERLKRYASLIYHWQKEQAEKTGRVPGCPFADCGAELSTQDERFRLAIHDIFASYAEYFQRTVADAGIDSRWTPSIAQELIAYTEGVIQQAKFNNDVEIIKRMLLPGLLQHIDPEAALQARALIHAREQMAA